MIDLHAALASWTPEPVSAEGRIAAWPATALTTLLGRPEPFSEGALLPPLWHYLYLLETPAPGSLGEDGHPENGPLLPPIPDRRRMFAGARVEWYRPIRVGDVVDKSSRVSSVRVKDGRSGQLAFVTVRTEIRVGGAPAVSEEQDLVYRSQPSGAARQLAAQATPEEVNAADFALDVSAPTLFQFSALTYNAHRIHYDPGYARDVEGYPGLVVHGPLQAIALLEPLRGNRTLERLTYRLERPAFAGPPFRVAATGDGDAVHLVGGTSTRTPSITGHATQIGPRS
jgi:3-methylfumaryl-CoA hydratase